jgi:3-phenylpropionate/trans-cinnamate dioxygenase ferredoxin reductase component
MPRARDHRELTVTRPSRVLIVGASLAGLRTAQSLRALDFEGEITILGAEVHPPYDRPPLSKGVLTGGRLALQRLAGVDDVHATWMPGDPATALDTDTGTVRTTSGARYTADAIVIATGASARPWDVPGNDLPGVMSLRTAEDASQLAAALDRAARILVVGGGFVGVEVAAAARSRGCATILVVRERLPLLGTLGREAAGTITAGLRNSGVDVRTSTSVTALAAGEDGALASAALDDGTTVLADVAVIGIGVDANTAWLRGSGLWLDDGVVCDESCRALLRNGDRTRIPIVTVGDVARWADPLRDGRLTTVRHWSNAGEQARAAAASLLAAPGEEQPYRHVPTFWSDLVVPRLQLKIRAVGHTAAADSVEVIEGSLDGGSALIAYGLEGRIVGAVSLNRPRRLPALRELILAGAPMTAVREILPTP